MCQSAFSFVLYASSHACIHTSFDYADRFAQARQELSSWIKDGSLKRRFHIVKGIENAPQALNLLFTGGNTGKL